MPNESIFAALFRRSKVALMFAIMLAVLICSGCGGTVIVEPGGDDKKPVAEKIDPPPPPEERVKMTAEEISEKIGPCVVNINAKSDDGTGKFGSGVIFTDDGFIITNDHVIRGNTSSIEIHLADKRVLKAKLVATDPRMDLAVIKVEADNLQAVKFGDSDEMKKGSAVVAIGNPKGLENSLTVGHISNLKMDMNEELSTIRCLQTDAAINPGNSGGALLNEYGELIGINIGGFKNSDNIGFAIPSNDVKRIVEQLKDNKHVPYPYLGVNAVNEQTDEGTPFIRVKNVRDNSPAAKAGLKAEDIIYQINDARVEIVPKLREQINNSGIGSTVSVYIVRSKKEHGIIEVTLEEIPKGYSSVDWS